MAKQIATNNSKPNAWIVSPKDKGRKSIKNGKVFLNDGDEFEIELFNPLTVSTLADIKLNGQSISKTGLVIKPGQRVYLDCFIDDKKKFVFKTYEIEGSLEAINATQNNGLLEVFFYKEDVITLDNWQRRFDKIIVEKHYYPYNNNPWYNPYTIYYGNGKGTNPYDNIIYGGTTITNAVINTTTGGSISDFGSLNTTLTSGSLASYSTDLNLSVNNVGSINTSIETGRVEKGTMSSQKFTEVEMEFDKNYISSTIIQILPESRKPSEIKEVKGKLSEVRAKDILKRESDEIIELIKKLSELHTAGILTDDEFSEKKKELLSKI